VAEIITTRIPLGVSACIDRCPVRYNGRALDSLSVLGRERSDFVLTPVCPECLAGLGVPRNPIHLTGSGAEVLAGTARVIDRRGNDLTATIIAGCHSAIHTLERAGVLAFVAKEASPTCGIAKARLGKRRTETRGAGVFGAMLLERDIFVIPDDGLANPLMWWDWRRRMHAWLWLRARTIESAKDLYDAWHIVKFVIQETDRPVADAMGRALAALPKNPDAEHLADLRSAMLTALRKPTTRARVRSSAFKTFVHAKKKGRLKGADLHDLTIDSIEARYSSTELAHELTTLERISFEHDLLFATSPVIRRDARRVRALAKPATD
jgi:uncharacterized protein YbbK (DUF523 family)